MLRLPAMPASLPTWLRDPRAKALAALLLVLLLGAIFHQEGAFFRWSTHRDMLREISVHGILACGLTLVIISGGIDLSVASIMALSAVAFALFSMPLGLGAFSSILLVLALGALAGLVSGALIATFRIQPFIITLAMMVFARGLAKHLSSGTKVTNHFIDAAGAPVTVPHPPIFALIDARLFGGNVSLVTLVFFACVALGALILGRLRVGRRLQAIGSNPEAARLTGVPVRRVLGLTYLLSGLFAAVAGICQAAQETHGDPETGLGYELDAIAMVVIGGTSLSGGKGSLLLTLIGALTIGYVRKILSINAFSTETRLMLTGAIITFAVLFQRNKA
jgi:ribose transport system permease protein